MNQATQNPPSPRSNSDNNGGIARFLERIDRRFIFLMVALSLTVPLAKNLSLHPAEMKTAADTFSTIENLAPKPGQIALISADWGPGTSAENGPQTELVIEHLLRKRIPFALTTVYLQAQPFLEELPRQVATRLSKESPGETWEYGKDWVNFGYQAGGFISIQSLAKSQNWHENLVADAKGVPLSSLPIMAQVRSIRDIALFAEFTGLVGVFGNWLQFFQGEGYRPDFIHGCTSVTIPEAYIFYSSRQILGFFEGVAGAAWYEFLLSQRYPSRPNVNLALRINTGLSYAHLVIIAFIILGNLGVVYAAMNRLRGV